MLFHAIKCRSIPVLTPLAVETMLNRTCSATSAGRCLVRWQSGSGTTGGYHPAVEDLTSLRRRRPGLASLVVAAPKVATIAKASRNNNRELGTFFTHHSATATFTQRSAGIHTTTTQEQKHAHTQPSSPTRPRRKRRSRRRKGREPSLEEADAYSYTRNDNHDRNSSRTEKAAAFRRKEIYSASSLSSSWTTPSVPASQHPALQAVLQGVALQEKSSRGSVQAWDHQSDEEEDEDYYSQDNDTEKVELGTVSSFTNKDNAFSIMMHDAVNGNAPSPSIVEMAIPNPPPIRYGPVSMFTLMKTINDFLSESRFERVSSRDLGRYLKSLQIGEQSILDIIKDSYGASGGLSQFLVDAGVYVVARDDREDRRAYWVSMRDDANDRLTDEAKKTTFSPAEKTFFDNYSLELLEDKPTTYVHTSRIHESEDIVPSSPKMSVSTATLTKLIDDFIAESGSEKVTSRDLGRYLKSLEILEEIKQTHGPLVQFLRDSNRYDLEAQEGSRELLVGRRSGVCDVPPELTNHSKQIANGDAYKVQSQEDYTSQEASDDHLVDLVVEYLRVSGGKADSSSVGRYLEANHALQKVKGSHGSLSEFIHHYSETFELFDSPSQISLRKDASEHAGANVEVVSSIAETEVGANDEIVSSCTNSEAAGKISDFVADINDAVVMESASDDRLQIQFESSSPSGDVKSDSPDDDDEDVPDSNAPSKSSSNSSEGKAAWYLPSNPSKASATTNEYSSTGMTVRRRRKF